VLRRLAMIAKDNGTLGEGSKEQDAGLVPLKAAIRAAFVARC